MAKKIFKNLIGDCLDACEYCKQDKRFSTWAKFVDTVDKSKQNGYAFIGDFLQRGTVEIDISRPRSVLVCTEEGSHKNRVKNYEILRINSDGSINSLSDNDDLVDSDKFGAGWALRMRDAVEAALLETIETFGGKSDAGN